MEKTNETLFLCFLLQILIATVSPLTLTSARAATMEISPYVIVPTGKTVPDARAYYLPRSQYRQLLETLSTAGKDRASTADNNRVVSVNAFSASTCTVKIEGDMARVTILASLYRKSPVTDKVVLLKSLGDAVITRARADGNDIAVEKGNSGQLTWRTTRAGSIKVELCFVCPLRKLSLFRYMLRMPVPFSAVNQLIVKPKSAKAKAWEIFANGAKAGSLWSKDKTSGLEGAFRPCRELEIQWTTASPSHSSTRGKSVNTRKRGDEEQEERQQLSFKFVHYVRVGDHEFRCRSLLSINGFRQGVSAFSFEVPEGLNVLDIRGPQLLEWSGRATKYGRHIVVKLSDDRLKGSLDFDVDMQGPVDSENAFLRLPIAPESYHEENYLALDSDSHIELDVLSKSDVIRPLDVSRFPSGGLAVKRGTLHSCYYCSRFPHYEGNPGKPMLQIALKVKRHHQAVMWTAVVDLVDATALVTTDTYVITRLRYFVKNNSEQFLKVDLPSDRYRLLTTFVSGKAVRPARSGNGELLVPLERSGIRNTQAAAFPVEITYLERMPSAEMNPQLSLRLPKINLTASTIRWTIQVPHGYKLGACKGNVRMDADYRPVDYLGKEEEDSGHALSTTKIFDTSTMPLRVHIPETGSSFYFSRDLVSAADEAPALQVRMSPTTVSRKNKKSIFIGAAGLVNLLLFILPSVRQRSYAGALLIVLTTVAIGIQSNLHDYLGLGLYFALGAFFGVLAFFAALEPSVGID